MRAVGVIPARFASSRFPGKPLATLLDKPLIIWVVEGASRSKFLERVIVATDDERIAEAVESAGYCAVLTSGDHKSGSDRIWEVASSLDADVIVNIQGDEATITGETIDACIKPFLDRDDIDVVTLCAPIRDSDELTNPHVVKVVTASSGLALYFSRSPVPRSNNSEVLSPVHHRHIGIYAYKREALRLFCETPPSAPEKTERLEQLRGLELGLRYHVVEIDYAGIDVNTPADLEKAIEVLKRVKGE